jgi:hypothetical protein
VRIVLLLLVMMGLLAGSLQAVAHVDSPAPTSSHAFGHADGGDAPAGGDQPGAQKHCDLCGHGFGHFAMAVPPAAIHPVRAIVHADTPAFESPTGRPDLQHRPPK